MFYLKPHSEEVAGQDLNLDVLDSTRPHFLTFSSCTLLLYAIAVVLSITEQGPMQTSGEKTTGDIIHLSKPLVLKRDGEP